MQPSENKQCEVQPLRAASDSSVPAKGQTALAGLWRGSSSSSRMAKQSVLSLLLVLSLARSSLIRPRKLLVFLIDGMRHDYISDEALESLPGFQEIVNRGVKVDYLTPDFPSLSYPNYYTLMTGE